MVSGEFGVASRPTESADYMEQLGENNDGSDDNKDNDTSSQARLVIIATAITGALLIIVVAAILCKLTKKIAQRIEEIIMTSNLKTVPDLILNSRKKKENRTPSGSTRSVLTFSNPNYNGADGNLAPVEPKVTIWKRLKYDKAQVSQMLLLNKSIIHYMLFLKLIRSLSYFRRIH